MTAKLLTKNYVDSTATIASGANADDTSNPYPVTFISNIYDGDKFSYWESDGADDDATMVALTITFASARTIDHVMIIGHNFKDLQLDYWDGAVWQEIEDEEALATDVLLSSFTAVSTTAIRFYGSATQVIDAEKRVAQVVAAALEFEFTRGLVDYRPIMVPRKQAELSLADGGERVAVVGHSANRSMKYECNARFDFLTAANIETLLVLKETGAVMTWQPEPVVRPDEVYQVWWKGRFDAAYMSNFTGAGFRLQMELREK